MLILKKSSCFIFLFLFSQISFSQEIRSYLDKGDFTLGLRTTTSIFEHDKVPALGTGGQFRLQFFDFLSTEWFADWITMDLKGAGTRQNAHIGWSVLFYLNKNKRFNPYFIAGHCFDFAQVTPLGTSYIDRSSEKISRWSSAVQAGLGAHYFLTERFNCTLSAQYMLHLGEHLEYDLSPTGNGYYLNTNPSTQEEVGVEGHVLLTFSLNYRIGDLW